MFKKIFSLIAVIEFVFIFQLVSPAHSSPVFGPKKYTIEKGVHQKFKETFNLCASSGEYKLIVDNGYNSEAEIKINGRELAGENDSKEAGIERKIILPGGEHQIEIEVKGKPAAFTTVSIECLNGCIEPKITFPSSGINVNSSEAVVLGDLSNLNGKAEITISNSVDNGLLSESAQVQGINFAGVIHVQYGQNTITATATDACGYRATDTITISRETFQESIKLTANLNGGAKK